MSGTHARPSDEELRELIEHQDGLISELMHQVREEARNRKSDGVSAPNNGDMSLIAEMAEQMKVATNAIQQILKKNDKLEAEISALKPEKPHSMTAGISGSMLDIHRELMIKEAELSSVRTTLALRTTELESSKAANQRLEDELSNLRDVTKLGQAGLLRKTDLITAELAQKAIECERLASENTRLQAECDELRDLGSQREGVLREYCKRLQDENSKLRKENTKLQYRMDSLREDNILLKLRPSRSVTEAEEEYKEFTKLLDESDLLPGTSHANNVATEGKADASHLVDYHANRKPQAQKPDKKELSELFNKSLLQL